MAKAIRDSYEENLDAVKESGSIAKQSKMPDPVPDPPKVKTKAYRGDSGQNYVPGKFSVPNADRGKGLGYSQFDKAEINMPNEFYDATVDVQNEIYNSELLEARAQEESGGTKLLAGIGRAAAKTGTEFGKGLGYLGGGVAAIFTQDVDTIVNNAFVNMFDEMDEAAKEAMPVYARREVTNGSLSRQLWSPEFWGTEAADAVGFMASSILLGGGLGAVSKGLGASKGLANFGRFLKVTQGGAKAEGAANTLINTLGQSYVESFAETDGAIKEFDENWEQQPDGTFMDSTGKVIDAQQREALRGSLGASTFAMNMVVTALPNYFTTKALFGNGGVSKNIFDELNIGTKSIAEMQEGLAAATTRKALFKNIAKEGATGSFAEGFQEASQFAIGEYEGAKSKMMTDDGLIDGLIDGYKKAFTTTEGLKSVFLGGLLGLGPGLVKGFKERKSRLTRAGALTKLMSENMVDLKQELESFYKKDADGKLIEKDGDYILDMEKLMSEVEKGEKEMNDESLMAFYKANGMTHAAKSLVARKMIQKALPYFQVEGGDAIFNEHLKEITDVMQSDGKLMGFSSTEAYTEYLNESVTEAKKEYDNIKNIGPRYFGINISEYAEKTSKPEAKKALEQFYTQMEAQGALYGALMNLNEKELATVTKQIQELETSTAAKEVTDPEAKEKLNAKQKRELDVLKYTKGVLDKNLKAINENYQKIFDKKQQQEAFDGFVQREMDNQATQEAYQEAQAKESEFGKRFRADVAEKYGETAPEAFNKNKVKLKDANDNIYAVLKMKGPEGQMDYYIMPVDNIGRAQKDKAVLVNEEKLRELGVSEKENIMTPEEFESWKNQQRVIVMNGIRLKRLNDLISSYERRRDNTIVSIEEKLDELISLNEKLDFWKNQNEIPLNEIADEINKLEQLIKDVQDEIDSLYDYTQLIKDNVVMLDAMRREIEIAIRDNIEFDFNIKMQSIKEYYEKNEFTRDAELLGVSMEIIEEQMASLTAIKEDLELTLEGLYEYIKTNTDFKNLLKSFNGRGDELASLVRFINDTPAIRLQYPELFQEPDNPNNTSINFQFVDMLMDDPEIRKNFLDEINKSLVAKVLLMNQNRSLISDIGLQLRMINKEYAKLKANDAFNHYANIIEKNIGYMKTKHNLANFKNQRKDYIKGGFGQTMTSKENEQEGSSSKEVSGTGPLKTNEYSTIVNVYKDASMESLHTNPKQLQQATDWSDAMMRVNLAELNDYSFRIVNNKQLAESGIVPPSDEQDDLYAILLKKGSPYIGKSGNPVFTGIAHVSTYFPDGKNPTIDIKRSPEYEAMDSRDAVTPISSVSPYQFEGNSYTTRSGVINAIIDSRKTNYRNWRDGLSMRTANGQTIHLAVESVSRGHAYKYGREKNNPKKVFNPIGLEIGDKFTKTADGKKIGVQQGAVYLEDANGQKHRLLNNTIGSLPEAKRLAFLNKIIKFMALAEELGKDYNKGFPFKGSKSNARMPLFGNSKKPGILSHFISWDTANPDWNIHMVTKAKTGKKAFVYHLKGEEKWLELSELFDSKGNIRNAADPLLIELVQYLDTKYMNVVSKNLNKKAMIPTGWVKNQLGGVELTYEFAQSYNDYVMDNYLYTDLPIPTESDIVPLMVNQYAGFGKEIDGAKPVSMEDNRKADDTPNVQYETVDMSSMFPGASMAPEATSQAAASILDAAASKEAPKDSAKESSKMSYDEYLEQSMSGFDALMASAYTGTEITSSAPANTESPTAASILDSAAEKKTVVKEDKKEEKKEEDCKPASPFAKKRKLGKK